SFMHVYIYRLTQGVLAIRKINEKNKIINMELIIQSLILFISLVVLAKSSDFAIDNSVKLSRMIKLREVTVGFLILSLATNLPEMSIAGVSLLSGEIGITIGNLFGSNVANIGLVLAVVAIIKPFKITGKTFKEFSTLLFYSSIIPLLLLLLNIEYATKTIGLGLVLLFAYFAYYSAKERIYLKVREPKKFSYKTVILLCIGLAGVVISSKLVVDSASRMADMLGIAETVIGASVISIATTVPELSLCISSARKNRLSLALGNIIGSSLTKITLLFGVVLILSTFKVDISIFSTLLMFVLLSNILAWRFFETDRRIEKTEGLVLLFVYVIFLIATLGIQIVF
ncbi:MAG: sodium:calcium antiporter, partial [Candidatus Aenigmarchaeota archaeon]|nr:sodium:calcium antiporter [Candidatus Aenigmarchaeota archaeon]